MKFIDLINQLNSCSHESKLEVLSDLKQIAKYWSNSKNSKKIANYETLSTIIKIIEEISD